MNAQGLPLLIARVLLALMFVLAGFGKFTGLEGTAGWIASKGLPVPTLLTIGAGVVELIGGLLLIVGWKARWAALALAAFTVLASLLFHNFWTLPADKQMMDQLMFLKNMAVTGGLLFVFAYGAGQLSLDARRPAQA